MKIFLLVIVFVLAGIAIRFAVTDDTAQKFVSKQSALLKEKAAFVALPVRIPSHIKKIQPPPGYKLTDAAGNGFGLWVQQLPLRKDNTVYLYDGSIKKNQSSHYAVLDVPYNRNPLQQCADAIMRLRAEYIFETKAADNIRFFHQRNEYFTCSANCTRQQLELFLNNVFSWCGSYNLQAQMKPVINIQNIQTGDVFVRGGSPGHAMLVAAVASNNNGEKVFLLLQSFMPAQDIHIVINPNDTKLSPWYSTSATIIATPGYTFTAADLRRW